MKSNNLIRAYNLENYKFTEMAEKKNVAFALPYDLKTGKYSVEFDHKENEVAFDFTYITYII